MSEEYAIQFANHGDVHELQIDLKCLAEALKPYISSDRLQNIDCPAGYLPWKCKELNHCQKRECECKHGPTCIECANQPQRDEGTDVLSSEIEEKIKSIGIIQYSNMVHTNPALLELIDKDLRELVKLAERRAASQLARRTK